MKKEIIPLNENLFEEISIEELEERSGFNCADDAVKIAIAIAICSGG